MSRKAVQSAPVELLVPMTADQLVAEHIEIDDYLKKEAKRFAECMKPWKDRQEVIDNQLLAMLNAQKMDSFKTDTGTAYLSTLMNASVTSEAESYQEATGREALLDFAVDHWDEIGSDLLMIKPQIDAIRRWMEEHEGKPPPGVKVSYFTRVNVRRS